MKIVMDIAYICWFVCCIIWMCLAHFADNSAAAYAWGVATFMTLVVLITRWKADTNESYMAFLEAVVEGYRRESEGIDG